MKNRVHKLIEAQNPKRKAALNNRIKTELNISDDTIAEPCVKKPFYKTYRFFAGVSTALVAICLAIVLPIVLYRGEEVPSVHYRNAEDCSEIQIDLSLKEYSEMNNLSYLYIDWYDFADERQTKLYVSEDNLDELIYVQELLVHGETGSIAVLYITDLYTRVDVLDDYWDACIVENDVNEIKVHWGSNGIISKGYFEYGNYRYFIELSYPVEEDSILDVIDSMLP